MKLFFRLLLAVFLLSFPFNAMAEGGQDDVPSLRALAGGGNVIFFRHAMTDHEQTDQDPLVLDDCKTQRNLSAQGRAQAAAIGAAITARGIPVGEVLSSPFCRCMETATLAFGKAEKNDALYYSIGASKQERVSITNALKSLLAMPVAPGSNRVIVSHTGNLKEAAGIWPKPEGVAWVFRPDGNGGFAVLGKVDAGDWAGLE